jgi:hypothetical protein
MNAIQPRDLRAAAGRLGTSTGRCSRPRRMGFCAENPQRFINSLMPRSANSTP